MNSEQISFVQRALGAFACEFTPQQLDNFYADAQQENASNVLYGTVAQAFYSLAVGTTGLTNFRQGETVENEAIINDRLWKLYSRWAAKAGIVEALPVFGIQQIQLHYIEFEDEIAAETSETTATILTDEDGYILTDGDA